MAGQRHVACTSALGTALGRWGAKLPNPVIRCHPLSLTVSMPVCPPARRLVCPPARPSRPCNRRLALRSASFIAPPGAAAFRPPGTGARRLASPASFPRGPPGRLRVAGPPEFMAARKEVSVNGQTGFYLMLRSMPVFDRLRRGCLRRVLPAPPPWSLVVSVPWPCRDGR